MPRIAIVLPIYLGAILGIPQLAPYQDFARALEGADAFLAWHVFAYSVGLPISVKFALDLEHAGEGRFTPAARLCQVLRMGALGVVVVCVFQLFSLFAWGSFGTLILLWPLIFIVAEALYETADFFAARARTR
ncbi:MAG: hypothetical protein GC189_10935 [Alphaproteobacteria bacterium]|nr:hypothetical protein [Alphaproteobacteria bacterium]